MPDSQQPPFWGPAYHERDLDALLSGTLPSGPAGNVPPALRPVESTLAALRAAPTRRELSAEASARAAFRALSTPQVPWTAPAEHGTVPSDTLVFPAGEHLLPAADRRPSRAARHRRRRRRASGGGGRSAIALTAVAAAAVIIVVIAVAVTGAIPGSIGQMVSFRGHPTSATSPAPRARQTPKSRRTTGGASHPTPSPQASGTPSASPSATTGPGTLCRELYQRTGQPNGAAKFALFEALTRLAGGPGKVLGYCIRLATPSLLFPSQRPFPAGSFGGYPFGPGDRGRGYAGPGSSGPGSSGPGSSGPGSSGPGSSGPGSSGPGSSGPGTSARGAASARFERVTRGSAASPR